VNSLRDENNRHIARAEAKAQEERERRIARIRKRPIFALFCADHEVDPSNISEDRMFEIAEQFEEAIADDAYRAELEERCKQARQTALRPRKTVAERLPGLLLKPAFKMLVVQNLGQLPPDEEDSEALRQVVGLYDTQTKEELQSLAEEWKWCLQNPRARSKLRQHLAREDFRDFCYHSRKVYPEELEEPTQIAILREFVEL